MTLPDWFAPRDDLSRDRTYRPKRRAGSESSDDEALPDASAKKQKQTRARARRTGTSDPSEHAAPRSDPSVPITRTPQDRAESPRRTVDDMTANELKIAAAKKKQEEAAIYDVRSSNSFLSLVQELMTS
jgi:hypothetical protein